MRRLGWILIATCALLAVSTAQAQEQQRFKLIGAMDSGELEHELNAAGAAGYRFAGSQGGRSTFVRSDESVVVMALDPDGRRFRYIVLATNRIGTMERELNEVQPEFDIVGMTALQEWGEGGAVILEAVDTAQRQDAVP